MRYFPSATRQRLAAASVAGVMSLGVLALPFANADDHLNDKKKQVEGQIERAQDSLQEASTAVTKASAGLEAAQGQLQTARTRLADVRTKLTTARERDLEMQRELVRTEASLALASIRLAAGEAAVVDQRAAVATTVRDIYTKGDPQLLAVASLLEAETPEDFTRRMAADDAIVNHSTRTYDDLAEAGTLLAVQRGQVKDATAKVAEQRLAAAENLTTMQSLFGRSQAVKVKVNELVASSRVARQEAFQARRADQEVLRRLESREEAIRQQILAASRNATGGFRGRTGGLIGYPVNGYVTSPFGMRTHPIYGYYSLHNGIDFGSGCGAPLLAGATGTVTSIYYDEVYGNRLFLNVGQVNGKNLTLVYNHASGYRVSEGARVGRGDVLGSMGMTGWSTGCHLHFTTLVNGTAVNPANFF